MGVSFAIYSLLNPLASTRGSGEERAGLAPVMELLTSFEERTAP